MKNSLSQDHFFPAVEMKSLKIVNSTKRFNYTNWNHYIVNKTNHTIYQFYTNSKNWIYIWWTTGNITFENALGMLVIAMRPPPSENTQEFLEETNSSVLIEMEMHWIYIA